MKLEEFNALYEYKRDERGKKDKNGVADHWQILKPNHEGKYVGDCEDYDLSVLYYVFAGESWIKFWLLLFTFTAQLRFSWTKHGEGHAILRYKGQYIDNWSKALVSKEHMEQEIGHRFHSWRYIPTTVLIRLLF